MRNRALGLGLLLLPLLLQACDGGTSPPEPARVVVSPRTVTMTALGETQQFSAQVQDEDGRPIDGVSVTWTSTNPDVASVSATGLATGHATGTVSIRAETEEVAGTAQLAVDPLPSTLAKVAGDEQTGGLLQPLAIQPTVEVRDARGNALSQVTVFFTVVSGGGTVNPASSLTDSEGQAATTWTLGMDSSEPQVLRARAGDVTTEFTATAEPGSIIIVTDGLEDGRATLTYEAFLSAIGGSETGYTWSVAGGAIPPGLDLSAGGILGGTPTAAGSYSFQVQVEDSEGATFSRTLSLRICPAPLDLNLGERAVLDPSGPDGCGFFLPAGSDGDRYRFAVVYASSEPVEGDVPAVTVTMEKETALGTGAPPAVEQTVSGSRAPFPVEAWMESLPAHFREALEVEEATEAYHHRLRMKEREMIRAMGRDLALLPDVPPALRAAAPSRAAPEKLSLNPNPDNECSAAWAPVTAVKIAENDLMAMYQDSTQHASDPLATGHAEMMLDYYEDYGKGLTEDYFGGVSDINGDGRIVVFVTPVVDADRIAAYVWSGDFFDRASCNSSNEMELIRFNKVVIDAIADGNYQPLATLVHEVKHVSSLYKSIARFDVMGQTGTPWHPLWVEEGTAEIAGEMSSRVAWEATGGPDVGDMIVRADKVITKESYGVLLRWARTIQYMSSQPNGVVVTPLGAAEGHTIYGSGWHFHRWLGDAYGNAGTRLADSAFFRQQNDSLAAPGVEGIVDLTGSTWTELMEGYAAAVLLNGTGAPLLSRPFATYDFPDVTTGLLTDQQVHWPGFYPWPVNVQGTDSTAAFASSVNTGPIGRSGLRVFDLTSDGQGQGLDVKVEGGKPPTRIVVVRIR